MSTLRESFNKWAKGETNYAGDAPFYDEVTDWWITTLKERIEKERKPVEHLGTNSPTHCEQCIAEKNFNAALDTITRLLE